MYLAMFLQLSKRIGSSARLSLWKRENRSKTSLILLLSDLKGKQSHHLHTGKGAAALIEINRVEWVCFAFNSGGLVSETKWNQPQVLDDLNGGCRRGFRRKVEHAERGGWRGLSLKWHQSFPGAKCVILVFKDNQMSPVCFLNPIPYQQTKQQYLMKFKQGKHNLSRN